MRRLGFLLVMLFMVFALSACKTEFEQYADNYAKIAFENLLDRVDDDIEIAQVDWICFDSRLKIGDDETTALGCGYYFEYNYVGSKITRYVIISVAEMSSQTRYNISSVPVGSRKALDDDYKESLDDLEKEDDPDVLALDYSSGSLSRTKIRQSFRAAQADD